MTVLEGKRCYLGAPIQFADDKKDWRPAVRDVLRNRFKIDLFDPIEDAKQQWVPILNAAIENKNYVEMAEIAKRFVRKDLMIVDRCDFVISNLPYKVPTTGTHHEIINSDSAKKPTLLVCEAGKEKIPAWYYGFIDHRYMFGSWDDLYQYLQGVNDHKEIEDFRWAYMYGLI